MRFMDAGRTRYNKAIRTLLLSISLVAGGGSMWALDTSAYTTESMLSSGTWVKICVPETGMYVITESTARSWGFSDLSAVKIFGYGGAPIDTELNEDQIDDLPQLPVYRTDTKLYFYAYGPTTWETQSGSVKYVQYQHPSATAAYYFVTDRSDIEPLEMSTISTTIPSSYDIIDTFTERLYHEEELYSPGETGSLLLGEDFLYTSSQTFTVSIPDYVSGTTVAVETSFGAKAVGGSSSRLTFQYDGTTLDYSSSDAISSISSSDSYTHCKVTSTVKTFVPTGGDSFDYTITFTNTTSTVNMARLDYITVNYTRQLEIDGSDFSFRTDADTESGSVLSVSGASSSTVILDVTDPSNPLIVSTTESGSDLLFAPAEEGQREYRAFNTSGSLSVPSSVGTIANQNLHGEEIPDMLIITPEDFTTQAERVASLHEDIDDMRVLVVVDEDIYNEFSSGTPDVMAYRKLAKMFYDRGTSDDGHKLQYLLMFGRSSYDNRQITTSVANDNFPRLLQWQTDVGDYDNTSYTTDDILGTLDDGTNTANMMNPKYGGMSIAVGRMPVTSSSEAKEVVDKLYEYVTEGDYGAWKNNVIMVADDGDSGAHMTQSEDALDNFREYGGESYVFTHLYLDAFNQISDGTGNYYPEARTKFYQKLDEGVLLVHYIGHANTVSWTHDGLVTITDLNEMYLKHIPFFYTATCEFSRVDADDTSGGEILYLNEQGGAIALFSTVRPTYISENAIISSTFSKYFFLRDDDNRHLTIGEISRLTKNNAIYSTASTSNSNKLRFILIGDPAMRVAYPTYDVSLETINGEEVSEDNMPEFMARQTISLSGSVYDTEGNKDTSFNGTVTTTLYDAEESIETNGNKASSDDEAIDPFIYYERQNRLAVVKDSVSNGEFSVRIVIPSEILYPESYDNYSTAMVNFYAVSDDGIEGNGSNDQFYIYGYDETIEGDTEGPAITMMVLNSEAFTDGDKVNESPMLIADIEDENGINFSTSGIGHQMTLLLDESTYYTDVSTYYTPSISDDTSMGGTIYYPLEDLDEGEHTLRLKVWDNFGNSADKTISFYVVTGLKPTIYDLYTTSSPAKTEANFYLKHDRPDATITVTLSIFNLLGQEIWSTTETGRSDMFTSFPITWDLTDSGGRRVQRGIYLYRAGISTDGTHDATKAKKIAVAAE